MATEFGKRLRESRKYAGLTQGELASKAGLASQGTIAELEKIGSGSSYTTQLAAACKVDAHWLSTGEGDMLCMQSQAFEAATNKLGISEAKINPATTSNPAKDNINLGDAMRFLAGYLDALDMGDRKAAMQQIGGLVDDPTRHAKVTAAIEAMAGTSIAQSKKKAA